MQRCPPISGRAAPGAATEHRERAITSVTATEKICAVSAIALIAVLIVKIADSAENVSQTKEALEPTYVASAASYSGDGKEILYTFRQQLPSRVEGVFVMPSTGGAGREITPAWPASLPEEQRNTGMRSAALSPDGKQIVAATSTGDLVVMGPDGQRPKVIAQGEYSDPVFSSDNATIAAIKENSAGPELWVMRADGGGQKRLTGATLAAGGPSFSHDGKRIVYTAPSADTKAGLSGENADEIWVIDVTGTNAKQLTANATADEAPAFSPDDSKIVFQRAEAEGHDIFVMDASGANVKQVTKDEAYDGDPTFSPDGSRIVFQRKDADSGRQDIVIVRADGTGLAVLTHPVGDESEGEGHGGEGEGHGE